MSPPLSLPTVLPVFPLTGSLLLPGNWLPLHVFEVRYRNMVEDALAGAKLIGMIQPLAPQEDNGGAVEPEEDAAEESAPALYGVGCAGRIEELKRTPDGRYLIALVGVSRFRVVEELAEMHGYRRVQAGYDDFAEDIAEPDETLASTSLLDALSAFGEVNRLSFDMDRLRQLSSASLVNGLSMALPFEPAEKQALLEADAEDRHAILRTLLEMGVKLLPSDDDEPAPMLN